MLEKIKSLHSLKNIFSFLDYKNKLALTKYNKTFQNKLNIRIINYKIFSGKYIIFEDNNIGKEYDIINSKLIRVGKYINGKWIGKIKEYFANGNLKFEGEYFNNNNYCIGKKYYENGKLEYEGEYLFHKKYNGKVYDIIDNIYYEIKDGKGFIKEYHNNNKLKFEGTYLNGEKHGKCKEYNYNGILEFDGEYLNGKKTEN